jgi:acyl dehydratase
MRQLRVRPELAIVDSADGSLVLDGHSGRQPGASLSAGKPDKLPTSIRQNLGVAQLSDWLFIDQAMITSFGELTKDLNPLHIDPAVAADGPFGETVAHGFLLLSMLSYFVNQISGIPTGVKASINRGFRRIKFLAPVRSGARIRNKFVISNIRQIGNDSFLIESSNTIQVEGSSRPAVTAVWEFVVIC